MIVCCCCCCCCYELICLFQLLVGVTNNMSFVQQMEWNVKIIIYRSICFFPLHFCMEVFHGQRATHYDEARVTSYGKHTKDNIATKRNLLLKVGSDSRPPLRPPTPQTPQPLRPSREEDRDSFVFWFILNSREVTPGGGYPFGVRGQGESSRAIWMNKWGGWTQAWHIRTQTTTSVCLSVHSFVFL